MFISLQAKCGWIDRVASSVEAREIFIKEAAASCKLSLRHWGAPGEVQNAAMSCAEGQLWQAPVPPAAAMAALLKSKHSPLLTINVEAHSLRAAPELQHARRRLQVRARPAGSTTCRRRCSRCRLQCTGLSV